MANYLPPFARMRQIRRDTVRPDREVPKNVEEALAAAVPRSPEPVFIVDVPTTVAEPDLPVVPPPELRGESRDLVVLDDATFGQPLEPDPVPVAEIKFDPQMKKSDLIAIAVTAGLSIDDTMTKSQIIAALKAANGQ